MPVGVGEIRKALRKLDGLYIEEFTFGGLRLDAAVIDIRYRKVRGFEIKVSREDFLQDKKWQLYSMFCSELSVVCPDGVLQPDDIKSPFGLLWISEGGHFTWKKRPKNIQHREALAWTFRYMEILEAEFPRLLMETVQLKWRVESQFCEKCGATASKGE